jgi:hypothetical protein
MGRKEEDHDSKTAYGGADHREKRLRHSTFYEQVGPCLCTESSKLFDFPFLLVFGGVVWRVSSVRAINEGSPRPRVARAQKIIRLHPFLCSALLYPIQLHSSLSGGVARLPFTARIGRAHSYRARSASKKGTWPLLPLIVESRRAATSPLGFA